MSFSSETKKEVIAVEPTERCCAKAELLAFLCFDGRIRRADNSVRLVLRSEHARVAKRIYALIRRLFGFQADITIRKGKTAVYAVSLSDEREIREVLVGLSLIGAADDLSEYMNFRIDPALVEQGCCKKAFVRGAFLAAGSVIRPEKNYHLEFVTHHYTLSRDFAALLGELGLAPKVTLRKSNYVIYYKNGEEIVDVLAAIGAYSAVMEFHNIRIVKEMRNQVNRQVNCETANVFKTVNASMRHVKAIEKLKENGTLEHLSEPLKEIARLRMEYPDYNLAELGQLLNPPVGKSGVNHRLRKLVEIAEKDEK